MDGVMRLFIVIRQRSQFHRQRQCFSWLRSECLPDISPHQNVGFHPADPVRRESGEQI